jgi:hypothetical protein
MDKAKGEFMGKGRVRWYWWVLALLPAVVGYTSLQLEIGDLRSSGFVPGVGVTIGILAVLLLVQRPWRGSTGLKRLVLVLPVVMMGLIGIVGLALGLPEFFQKQFGWFLGPDTYGARAVVAIDEVFVVVGDDLEDGLVWYSADGVNWSRANDAELLGLEMRDAIVADGDVVAFAQPSEGGEAMVLTSVDGKTWSLRARFGNEQYGTSPHAIAQWQDEFVGVTAIYGNDVEFFYGDSVTSWRSVEPSPVFDDGEDALDVACSPQVCVAVGERYDPNAFMSSDTGAMVWTSTNGQRWDLVDHSMGIATLVAVAAANDAFVVVGNEEDHAVVWTSLNGRDWSQLDGRSFGSSRMDGVVDVDGGFVAFGRDTETGALVVWKSETGAEWKRSTVDEGLLPDSMLRSVAANGETWVAVGIDTDLQTAAIWVSDDGDSWERVPHDEAIFG